MKTTTCDRCGIGKPKYSELRYVIEYSTVPGRRTTVLAADVCSACLSAFEQIVAQWAQRSK